MITISYYAVLTSDWYMINALVCMTAKDGARLLLGMGEWWLEVMFYGVRSIVSHFMKYGMRCGSVEAKGYLWLSITIPFNPQQQNKFTKREHHPTMQFVLSQMMEWKFQPANHVNRLYVRCLILVRWIHSHIGKFAKTNLINGKFNLIPSKKKIVLQMQNLANLIWLCSSQVTFPLNVNIY